MTSMTPQFEKCWIRDGSVTIKDFWVSKPHGSPSSPIYSSTRYTVKVHTYEICHKLISIAQAPALGLLKSSWEFSTTKSSILHYILTLDVSPSMRLTLFCSKTNLSPNSPSFPVILLTWASSLASLSLWNWYNSKFFV